MKTWKDYVNEGTKFSATDMVTIPFDVSYDGGLAELKHLPAVLKKKMLKYNVKMVKFNEGIRGGWPEVTVKGKFDDVMKYLKNEYDKDYASDVKSDPTGMGVKKV